jgi:putative membrane protein
MLSTLPAFAAFLALACAVVAVFLSVYLWVTPYHELRLVREGNPAAAVSFSGTLVGFALPVASVVRSSRDLAEVAVWSAMACLVQLAAYGVARLVVPRLPRQIAERQVAPAIFLAALSVAVGLVNAACLEG